MAWLKLTDEMGDHRKVRRTVRGGGPAGLAAFGLHILGMLHSARYLTDGDVEREFVEDVFDLARLRERDQRPVVERLEHNGLWVPGDDGAWRIHDYLDHNPSREEVEDRRRRDAERKAAGRAARSGDSPASVRADRTRTDAGHVEGSARPVPSRPSTRPETPPSPLASEGEPTALDLEEIKAQLRGAVTDSTWAIYLAVVELEQRDDGALLVTTPDAIRSWVRDRFVPVISRVASHVAGRPVDVEVAVPVEERTRVLRQAEDDTVREARRQRRVGRAQAQLEQEAARA